MKNTPTFAEVIDLFNNNDPDRVWDQINEIVRRINPDYDFTLVRVLYDDVVRMFAGEYPGYCAIKTPYHDLSHTLDVFLCGVRLMHGVHLSGDRLSDDEITLIMSAILMHDVGYAQRLEEEGGTGAQFTQTHVQRGIAFMRHYFADHKLPPDATDIMAGMISGTEHTARFSAIKFKNDRAQMLARIVATADLIGQMADRKYLEKLMFLYQEFKEAHFGSYQNMYEMLSQTNHFYELTREKLDGELGGIYRKLVLHFKDRMDIEKNYYIESIEKNIDYLKKVVAQDEATYRTMLKRNTLVAK